MQYYNNILCVEGGWLYETAKVMSKSIYRHLTNRNQVQVLRRACKGHPALVAYDSIPERFRKAIENRYGNPYKKVSHYQFSDELQPDPEAATYYSEYRLADGRNLPESKQIEYRTNAEILNAAHKLYSNTVARRKAMGGTRVNLWGKLSRLVNSLDTDKYKHTLPNNERRLKAKYKAYIKEGYPGLIHKGYGNNNSRKVTVKIESLVLSLYTLPNKPYATTVHELYFQFLGGAIDVTDIKTGELFNKDDFKENGVAIAISEATVWNYLNDPKNRVLLDKYRSGALEFSSTHRPHHHRHRPKFSLSKISMDDRDLPRKMHNGKRLKAYYAYDVTSGCIIGASYSRNKDKPLFIDCMRDMFRFINSHGLGMPMEAEVEHHLVEAYKDDLMKAGTIFPFVRWANPGNAQEKYAETLNRVKKYGYEKRYQDGIGRFYSKLEANRTHQDKVFDAENNTYKEKKTYDFEELIADDMMIIKMMNNDEHPDQKRYKGMTRLEVLLYCVNPKLAKYDEPLLARYIGQCTPTSIRRSQYVRVQYSNYQLPNPQILSKLQPNNYQVDAWWLPGEKGGIDRVYLYQDDVFICGCDKITTYNTATAEQTQADRDTYQSQASYVSSFDSMVKKDEKVSRVVISKPVVAAELPEVEIIETTPEVETDTPEDFQAAIAEFSGDYYKKKARADI